MLPVRIARSVPQMKPVMPLLSCFQAMYSTAPKVARLVRIPGINIDRTSIAILYPKKPR